MGALVTKDQLIEELQAQLLERQKKIQKLIAANVKLVTEIEELQEEIARTTGSIIEAALDVSSL